MVNWSDLRKGMGFGGWLTNYKRFNVLPIPWRFPITVGDEEHFDTYLTEKDIAYVKKLGFDHVRLCFDQVVIEREPYKYDEHSLELVKNFVNWCKKYNLNVVLNMSKAIGNYCDITEPITLFDDETLQDRFIKFWIKFEQYFSDEPDVIFELLNEVRNIDPKLWNDLYIKTVTELRKLNKDRKIIIGSTCWEDPARLNDLVVLEDDENIGYTFHIYFPVQFTHQQGVLQEKPLYYNRKLTYPSDEIQKYRDYQTLINEPFPLFFENERVDYELIKKFLQPAIDFKKKHPNKFLWNGEFGTIRHIPIEYRENYMNDVIKVCIENDIPYSVWNYLSTPNDGNRFSLVDDETRKVLSKKLQKILLGKVR